MARLLMPRRAQRGMSVIEALVTFLVASVGFMAVARMETVATDAAVVTSQGNEALHYAEDKLNALRANGSYAGLSSSTSGDTLTSTNATYTRTWSVTNWTFNASGGLVSAAAPGNCAGCFKQVTVTVQWTDVTGTSRYVNLMSNFANVESSAAAGLNNATTGTSGTSVSNSCLASLFGVCLI